MSTPSTTTVNPPVHDFFDDDSDEEAVPPSRHRALTPLTATLAATVLVGIGVFGGIVAQKHYGGSSASSGQAAAFSRAGAGGGSVAGGAGFGGATVGQVSMIKGNTLYVTDQSGNTVKVKTTGATPVTTSVNTKVTAVYPGDNVTVLGAKDASGSIRATSITLGAAGAGFAAAGAPAGRQPAPVAVGATGSAKTTANSAGSTATSAPALSSKFTTCLAQHGVKPSGSASAFSSAKGQAAIKACQPYAPKGRPSAPAG